MENLPIPKLRSGWVAALLVAMAVFLIYYVFVFDILFRRVYESQFDVVYFEKSQNQIDVWASVPRYYTPSEPAWIYMYVKNKGADPLYGLEVYMIADAPDAKTLLLPNLYKNEVYSSGAKFEVLAPGYVTAARISFISQEEPTISKVLLIKNENDEREELAILNPKEFVRVNKSNLRALQHGFLETILLPPWSNGFILAVVLFSVYLVNKIEEKEEPEIFGDQWWDLVWETIVKSVWVLTGISVVIVLFLSINEMTIAPIFCFLSLFVYFVLEKTWLKTYVSDKVVRILFRFSYFLLVIGIASAWLNLLATFYLLGSRLFSLNWMPFNFRWAGFIGLVFVGIILRAKWKSPALFSYSTIYCAYQLFPLSVTCIVVTTIKTLFLTNNAVFIFPNETFPWIALALVSLIVLIYRRTLPGYGVVVKESPAEMPAEPQK